MEEMEHQMLDARRQKEAMSDAMDTLYDCDVEDF
mgnify:CR=1 FL=1|jgi:hypothetical protein